MVDRARQVLQEYVVLKVFKTFFEGKFTENY
jgi:hypothetical protein